MNGFAEVSRRLNCERLPELAWQMLVGQPFNKAQDKSQLANFTLRPALNVTYSNTVYTVS